MAWLSACVKSFAEPMFPLNGTYGPPPWRMKNDGVDVDFSALASVSLPFTKLFAADVVANASARGPFRPGVAPVIFLRKAGVT